MEMKLSATLALLAVFAVFAATPRATSGSIIQQRAGRAAGHLQSFMIRSTLTLIVLVYVPVVLACVETLNCIDASSTSNDALANESTPEWVLRKDTNEVCGTDKHQRFVVLATATLIALVIVFPSLVSAKLRTMRNRGELRKFEWVRDYGSVFLMYREKWIYFEAILCFRKSIETIAVLLQGTSSATAHAATLLIVNLVYFLLIWKARPFAPYRIKMCGRSMDWFNTCELYVAGVIMADRLFALVVAVTASASTEEAAAPLIALNGGMLACLNVTAFGLILLNTSGSFIVYFRQNGELRGAAVGPSENDDEEEKDEGIAADSDNTNALQAKIKRLETSLSNNCRRRSYIAALEDENALIQLHSKRAHVATISSTSPEAESSNAPAGFLSLKSIELGVKREIADILSACASAASPHEGWTCISNASSNKVPRESTSQHDLWIQLRPQNVSSSLEAFEIHHINSLSPTHDSNKFTAKVAASTRIFEGSDFDQLRDTGLELLVSDTLVLTDLHQSAAVIAATTALQALEHRCVNEGCIRAAQSVASILMSSGGWEDRSLQAELALDAAQTVVEPVLRASLQAFSVLQDTTQTPQPSDSGPRWICINSGTIVRSWVDASKLSCVGESQLVFDYHAKRSLNVLAAPDPASKKLCKLRGRNGVRVFDLDRIRSLLTLAELQAGRLLRRVALDIQSGAVLETLSGLLETLRERPAAYECIFVIGDEGLTYDLPWQLLAEQIGCSLKSAQALNTSVTLEQPMGEELLIECTLKELHEAIFCCPADAEFMFAERITRVVKTLS